MNNPNLFMIFLSLVFVWLGVLTFFLWQTVRHYKKLTEGVEKKDLRSVLEKLLRDLDDERRRLDNLVKIVEKLNRENIRNIQKIGLVRFNPFAGTGGDQSFCLALLDGEDNGLVISSLHSREVTRIYAKPIKRGKAVGYQLSTEEIQAIKNAKKLR
ncbi:MAG: DUF4446 family protein [Microgenomates group bacterium]